MPAFGESSFDLLARLIAAPAAPVVIDLRASEGETRPVSLTSIRRNPATAADGAAAFAGRRVGPA